MLADRVTKVSFFTIYRHAEHGWTVYNERSDIPDLQAGQLEELINEFAATGQVPGEPEPVSIDRKRPERYLDIDVGFGADVQAFAFYLNAWYPNEAGENLNRLEFMPDEPFIFLPINASLPDDILEVPQLDSSRCAYFLYDVGAARSSDLAARVADYAAPHRPSLNIPFCFNLIDPVLGAAPWLVSSHHPWDRDHDHGHHHDRSDGHGAVGLTHGGVHPATASFLSIDPPQEA